jgi:feruloyl esterase
MMGIPGFPVPPLVADLCLVKLLVGPGNPGPGKAPSTSPGMGIEVWLPAKAAWTGRVHTVGAGGWAGGQEATPDKVAFTIASDTRAAPIIAAEEGAVTSNSDTGHANFPEGAPLAGLGGSFAMNPDGTINTILWEDYSFRALHEMAVVTKALATAYYGSAPKFSYFDGASGGGRQALKIAQRFPDDYDGILSVVPAINWTQFTIAEAYVQVVIQRDLGGKYMTPDQLNLVSNAAIGACDVVNGQHLGFILDPSACRYDPTKDRKVLCTADRGTNGTPACVTRRQAFAINKFWYGMTSDGSVPDPAVDNGFGPLTGKHKWYGLPRGTSLLILASDPPFGLPPDMVALALQDPGLASSSFRNAKANGTDGWKALSYKRLAQAFDAGVALQDRFEHINTDDPDLSAFKARGGKLIHVNASDDGLIPYQGSLDYYDRVVAAMGGLTKVQQFYRFYVVAGMGHGLANGTANPNANPPAIPLRSGQVYRLLTDWVEKGVAPETVLLKSAGGASVAKSLPMCVHPMKPSYRGGDIVAAESYACRR